MISTKDERDLYLEEIWNVHVMLPLPRVLSLALRPPSPWKVSACRGEVCYQKEGVAWKGGRERGGSVEGDRGAMERGAFGMRGKPDGEKV